MKIVFIITDGISQDTWAPLIKEAGERGHEVVATNNINEAGDIGFYCDDYSIPGKQNICIVSINGLDQDHVVRPHYKKYFEKHNWGLFDLGLLPGPRWMDGWLGFPHSIRTSPRLGIINIGWPKSDPLFLYGDPAKKQSDLAKPDTVLYAPQTEQDGKQTQVVNAINKIGLKLVIKHWESPDYAAVYPELLNEDYFSNLEYENEKAKKFQNVTVLDPTSNFINALDKADILITDQSSVIYEAALVGIPAISVHGWKHACGDCKGPQPSPDLCGVAEEGNLAEFLSDIMNDYQTYVNCAKQLRSNNFKNLGKSSKMVIDIVEQINKNEKKIDVLQKKKKVKRSIFAVNKKILIWYKILKKIIRTVYLKIIKLTRTI